MEHFEAFDSVSNKSPLLSSSAHTDSPPSDQTLQLRHEKQHLFVKEAQKEAAPDAAVETLNEEIEKLFHLKEEEEDKQSIEWNQDDDFKSGGSNGVEEQGEHVSVHNADENNKIGDDLEKKDESSSNNGDRSHQYPVRPEAEDCSYYMKTGTCKFGSNCKFNHPIRRKNQTTKEKVKEREEAPERPGQTECKYYLRTGGCKYGKACRYNHSKTKSPVLPAKTAAFPVLDLNFLGLPIRLGERECPYYMRNGSCKYGANCRFNHPDPTAVGGSDPPSSLTNGGSASLQSSSQSGVASWSSPRGPKENPPFVPIMFSPAQQNPEWNGHQAPIYPPERSIHPPAIYSISPITDTNVYAHQQQLPVDEFPERPGQPECSYYMKTGDCKFKSNCKYHHPKSQISKTTPTLSDKGLPLRPGQNICSYYGRYGICKFGPACKFDHPIQPALSTAPGNDQGAPFSNSAAKEEARMTETGNGNDAAIKQLV